jgi:hypothetical protein
VFAFKGDYASMLTISYARYCFCDPTANVPSVLAFQANNTVTHTKKSVSSAIVIGMGGVGGIMASTVYRQADFPRYM